MSIDICPYDGNHCQKMESRFNAWQKFVLQTEGVVFPVKSDAFSDCPISNIQNRKNVCERFRGCLVAISNTAVIQRELATQYE